MTIPSAETPTARPLHALETRLHEPFSAADLSGNLWQRFSFVVDRYADHPALVHGERTMTYGQLLRSATALAAQLPTEESPTRSPVALLTDNPLQRIAGMWTALRAGRPFLPIDTAAPGGRIQMMLRDSGASAVVTDDPSRSALSLFDGAIIGSAADVAPALDEAPSVAPDDPALLLYTSGSTGRPKRVVQQHGMILDSLSSYSQALRIAPDDRLSLLASPGFGEAWNDVFLALLNGACVCFREAKSHGVDGLADWLAESRITILHCVPTLLRALTANLPLGTAVPRLRIANLGGEAVSRTDVRLCVERLNADCVVVNSYGSTETKLIAQHFVDRETILDTETLPVGRAREGVEIRLLGENGEPAPPGEVGEIEVCSRSVVQGYDAEGQADQERFVHDDSSLTRYRTGDLGRLREDGLLEYLGRRDQMVKLRGYRIELAEIESLLQAHPGIQQAVVVVHEASPERKQLVAAYQSRGHSDIPVDAFRATLCERLPDYMLPSRYLRYASFPLTQTGKPDRRRLQELVSGRLREEDAAPSGVATDDNRSSTAKELRQLASKVLQIDDVRMEAGFIELGGDSLNVTEFLIRVNEHFNTRLTADDVFSAKSLRQIADRIDQLQS